MSTQPAQNKKPGMQSGEHYQCSDQNCGSEIQVTKGIKPGMKAAKNPTCGCGKEMQLKNQGSSIRP